ncbi:alpha-glucan family phosphorylase [Candidatus Woesearchaeota archaeon]|nr:alpha-glucan family phosphorylase [Candidatus Woesearchaeota archaeon]
MQKQVAIYSQEWGFSDGIKLYNGGLGVLNGCLAYAYADLAQFETTPKVVAVGINYRNGLLEQRIENNWQVSNPDTWDPAQQGYVKLHEKVKTRLYDTDIVVGAWKKSIISPIRGESIDSILLDANEPENPEWARWFTASLYDNNHKLPQDLILGLAGPEMLEKLGYDISLHHMQEGAASFVALRLLNQNHWNVDSVREQCVYTNHTPIEAGMPKFKYEDVYRAIGHSLSGYDELSKLAGAECFNTNLFAANLSRYTNGVSRLHAEVMKEMPEFKGKTIDYITNGVHWRFISDKMQRLFDEHIQGNWRLNPELLSHAASIDSSLMQDAHSADKRTLIGLVNEHGIKTADFSEDVFTAVYAKRITPYKNPQHFLKFLVEAQNLPGPVQIIYSGKVHRDDGVSHNILHEILGLGLAQKGRIKFAFLPGYSMEYGKILTVGADLWVVTAEPREEASGTSPFKAGMNGNKTLSRDGGAWPEVEGRFGENGYTFETPSEFQSQFRMAMDDFNSGKMAKDMPGVIAEFGPKFSAVRMINQYIERAYRSSIKPTVQATQSLKLVA